MLCVDGVVSRARARVRTRRRAPRALCMHARALLARRLRVVVLRGASGHVERVVCVDDTAWPCRLYALLRVVRWGVQGGLPPARKFAFSAPKNEICHAFGARRGAAALGGGGDV